MFVKSKRRPKGKAKCVLVLVIVITMWVIGMTIKLNALGNDLEKKEMKTIRLRSSRCMDKDFLAQKERYALHDEGYLKIAEKMSSGKFNSFGTPSERDLSKQPFDVVLNLKSFDLGTSRKGLEAMLLKFFVRSIEKFFVPYNPRGKMHILVQAKNKSYLSGWLSNRVRIVGYDEIFPSPEYNLPTMNINSVETSLRSVPGISNNFFFFKELTFLKGFLSVSKFLSLDGKVKLCK